jgi:hypothetical protein
MAGLTQQQQYLLGRLPKSYDYQKFFRANNVEPARVQKARKVIEEYEKSRDGAVDSQEKQFVAQLNEAREAIYFKQPGDALQAVKALEAKLRKKA